MLNQQISYILTTFKTSEGYAVFAEIITGNMLSLEYKRKFVSLEELNKIYEASLKENIAVDFRIEDGFLHAQPMNTVVLKNEEIDSFKQFCSSLPEITISPMENNIYELLKILAESNAYYINLNARTKDNTPWYSSTSDIGIASFKNLKCAENKMCISISYKVPENAWGSRNIITLDNEERLIVNDFIFAIPAHNYHAIKDIPFIEIVDTAEMYDMDFKLCKLIGENFLPSCYGPNFDIPYPLLVRYSYLSKFYKVVLECLVNYRKDKINAVSLGAHYDNPDANKYSAQLPGVFVRTNYVKPRPEELRFVCSKVIDTVKDLINKKTFMKVLKYIDDNVKEPAVAIACKTIAVFYLNKNSDETTMFDLLNNHIKNLELFTLHMDLILFAIRATDYFNYYYSAENTRSYKLTSSMETISGDSLYTAIYERVLRV